MNLSKFKQFESSNGGLRIKDGKLERIKFIQKEDIKDYFLELLDSGFTIKHTPIYSDGKYFFEFKKELSDDSVGFIGIGDYVYGVTNLSFIKNEFDNIIDILDESKDRLTSSGYIIAFEIECNFLASSMISIVCHMQHESIGGEDWSN